MDREVSGLVQRVLAAGQIVDADVLSLRDLAWRQEAISFDMLDALFQLSDRCTPLTPAWSEFFVEIFEHALLRQTPPPGFLGEDGARWLRARIDGQGMVASLSEVELLVSLVEHAENAPEWLKAYALAQVEATIVSGIGPTRKGGSLRPNCVDEAEVQLLRRLIFGGGGEGAIIVGPQEADMLFRIKDATLGGDNAPGWLKLFVQGVGNHLLSHSGYRPLAQEEALRLNAEMARNTPSIAGFFGRMLPSAMLGRGTIVAAFKAVFPDGEDGPAPKAAAPDELSPSEAAWLKRHIAADGETDPYEKALLTFILDEAGQVPVPIAEQDRQRA